MKNLIIKEMNLRGKETYTKEEVIDMLERYDKVQVVESYGVSADMGNYEITRDETKLKIPKKEFLLVHYFIKNKNKVMRRERILADIWGTDVIVCDRTIDVHIRKIRERLPNIPLTTIKGVGYIWRD